MDPLGNRAGRPSPRRAGELRDLLLITLTVALLFAVGTAAGFFQALHGRLSRLLGDGIDEAFGLVALLAAGLALFTLRRWLQTARGNRDRTETQARFQALVEQIPAIFYTWDPSGPTGTVPMPYVSPQIASILGYTQEEWTRNPRFWITRLHPDDRDRVVAASNLSDSTGAPFALEYRLLAKDDSEVWIRDESAVVAWSPAGTPALVQGVMFDITGSKRAEEKLLEAELKYRMLIEQLPVITYTESTAFTNDLIYVSPQIETILGYTPEEWMADPEMWARNLHPDDRDRALEADRLSSENGEPFVADYRCFSKDGREVWMHNEARLIHDEHGKPRFWQGLVLDITERKLAEQRLAEAEAKYRALVEQVPVVVYADAVDDVSTALYMSPRYEQLLGYTVQERLAQPDLWVRTLHPEDRERVVAESIRTNETGEPFRMEYRLIAKDGRTVWVRDEGFLVRNDAGEPLVWQGVLLDISERKLAEETLRETEERYRVLVEHIPAVLYVDLPDDAMTTVYVSPQIEEVLGITQEGFLGSTGVWSRCVHPEDLEDTIAAFRDGVRGGEPFAVEYRWIRPDGEEIWVRDEVALLHDEEGKYRFVQGVMFDVTERWHAEQTLRESEQREREAAERLRTLDEMKNTFLAAVSHELRSPLTSILGLALTLERQDTMSFEDQSDLLGRLAANARKLDRLLKDLLDIDRLNRGIVTPNYRRTDIGLLARRTAESLDVLGDRNLIVETSPVIIPVDPAKVERIVENLLANAARHTTSAASIWLRVAPFDSGALLAIEDDGPGVPKDLQEVIFEPFRQGPTASPHAPGTGIGLSLVAMFAELHGGRAWVEDREGGGASFRVFLPGVPGSREQDAQPDGVGRLVG